MTHIRWTPARHVHFDPRSKLFNGMESIMENFLHLGQQAGLGEAFYLPHVTTWETDEEYFAEVEVPGVPRDELSVEIDLGVLRVVRTSEEREESLMPERRETRRGSFTREITILCELEPEGHEARLKDGVLTVCLKKVAVPRPKATKVEIE